MYNAIMDVALLSIPIYQKRAANEKALFISTNYSLKIEPVVKLRGFCSATLINLNYG